MRFDDLLLVLIVLVRVGWRTKPAWVIHGGEEPDPHEPDETDELAKTLGNTWVVEDGIDARVDELRDELKGDNAEFMPGQRGRLLARTEEWVGTLVVP